MKQSQRMMCGNCQELVRECKCPNHLARYSPGLLVTKRPDPTWIDPALPMTRPQLQKILDDITYKNWKHRVTEKGSGWNYQCIFQAACSISGVVSEQKSRKWYISSYACKSEIVRTVYKAVISAETHEIDENFKYKQAAIYDPHRDVESMVRSSTYQDVRKWPLG